MIIILIFLYKNNCSNVCNVFKFQDLIQFVLTLTLQCVPNRLRGCSSFWVYFQFRADSFGIIIRKSSVNNTQWRWLSFGTKCCTRRLYPITSKRCIEKRSQIKAKTNEWKHKQTYAHTLRARERETHTQVHTRVYANIVYSSVSNCVCMSNFLVHFC